MNNDPNMSSEEKYVRWLRSMQGIGMWIDHDELSQDEKNHIARIKREKEEDGIWGWGESDPGEGGDWDD